MSEPKTFQLPDATKIRLVSSDGEVLFEEEAIYIDDLLSKAQEDVDVSGDSDAVNKWLPKFKELLSAKFDYDLGDTEAYFIAREATSVMWSLKKKFDNTRMSLMSSESMPSS
ncbi:MAG: hypothetical protein ACPGO0_00065 [Acidimicrobiales bacterium]|jgi:hypothetical protein|tara:strand:+ start:662 stop:997 length:336 start_codon:yes stop_codon:yes gene_type:complete